MTKDQYLRMVEQTGEEIDWDKCPPELSDFPEIVVDSLNIFNSLGSRIYPDVGYIGKDYTNLPLFKNLYGIEEHQEEYLMDLLLLLESRSIEQSQKSLKAQMDKIKKK